MTDLENIRARRAMLVARAAVQREGLALQLHAWERPLALVDKSVATVRNVRRHPEWVFGIVAVFAILRPRRAYAWARRGFAAWRAWQWANRALRDLSGQKPA